MKKLKKLGITKIIILICLLLQVLQTYCPEIAVFQCFVPMLAGSLKMLPFFFEGLLVHMFSHAGWGHLLGNMSIGIPCMIYLEHKLGGRQLLQAYLILGVVAALVQAVMPFSGLAIIGSSGAIFGLFGLSCVLLGRGRGMAPLALSMLALGLIPQLMALNLGPLGNSVAHGAHIGGLVGGMCLGMLLKD
jgi:uncharacterized protein